MSADRGPRERSIAAERQLLAALCQVSLGGQAREELLQRLEKHRFATPDHQVVFEALRKLPTLKPGRVREALTATVTRMGFPDADVNIFFELQPPTEENLPDLWREL